MNYTTEIKTISEGETIIYVEHKGPYPEIGPAFQKLYDIATQHNLLNEESRVFGVFYDNPDKVKEEDLRSAACITVSKDTQVADGAQLGILPVGKYITTLHQGPYEQLMPIYNYLYGTWSTENNMEPDLSSPTIEEYLNSPMEVAPEDLKTRVYVPLA